ncbi:MAG: flagellar biosynthesis protein [Paenibacillus sp.]|nr:flagellar biosynthesis protein [Paenibacillus sp.]
MSNVIKAAYYIPIDDKKVIRVAHAEAQFEAEPIEPAAVEQSQEVQSELAEANAAKEQIIHDAESYAESLIAQATAEAKKLRNDANSEIESWWRKRRESDEQAAADAKKQGYEAGFQQGLAQAEAQVRGQYEQLLGEARTIIESAVAIKQQMIQESEPFLIELSCSIAEKIITRQLSLEPSWSIELIKKVLTRRREQGVITLCVSPEQFQFVADARDELALALDSQAELQIIPDPGVLSYGCVVRSSFGSIDAKIDTQLTEIKKALQQMAIRSEGGADDE